MFLDQLFGTSIKGLFRFFPGPYVAEQSQTMVWLKRMADVEILREIHLDQEISHAEFIGTLYSRALSVCHGHIECCM